MVKSLFSTLPNKYFASRERTLRVSRQAVDERVESRYQPNMAPRAVVVFVARRASVAMYVLLAAEMASTVCIFIAVEETRAGTTPTTAAAELDSRMS